MPFIKNWREMQPQVRHMSAVTWPGLRDSSEEDTGEELHRMTHIKGLARHALQGRMTSDFHNHDCIEQVYYILSGGGDVLFEGERYPTKPGDAVYLPSGPHHQMFNDLDPWLEHHVISAQVESDGGTFAIRNWKDVPPQGDGAGAVRWHQLGRESEEDVGFTRRFTHIDREAVQPGGKTIERKYDEVDHVYYILENKGVLIAEGEEQSVTEGDNIHLPPGTSYEIRNPHEEWLTYLIVGSAAS